MNELITILLPSLIHRIGREAVKQAQLLATQQGCELKRVRRSRNWSVSGNALDVQALNKALAAAKVEAFRYLIQKLDSALLLHADKLEPLAAKLVRLINENPNVTLNELIELTQCSITEARLARFQADAW